MGLHKPFDRHFVVIGGNVMTSGGSLGLTKGQLGLFDTTAQTVNGQTAVNTLAGQPRDKNYQLKIGTSNRPVTRSHTNKSDSTFPFSMNDVLKVSVSAPDSSTQKVDEVVVGYNGISADTSISFAKGERKEIFIRLSGEAIGAMGFPDNYVDFSYVMAEEACNPLAGDCVECDDCATVSCTPIILRAIEFLENYEIRGGVKASEFIEITPVRSCTTDPDYNTTNYSVWTLTVADIGDSTALALVQAQYPTYPVTRTQRNGVYSVYQIIALTSATLAAYTQTVASLIKGCDDCPADYTATTGGYLYAVSIEDAGADLTTTVDDLTGFVTGTVVKSGQNNGVGFYTLILSAELSDANLATFLAASVTKATATVQLIGEADAICEHANLATIAWVAGETCTASFDEYTIVLPDTECGTNRLAELRAAYPNNSIVVSGTSSTAVTLTGTGGTANINIQGDNYLATFDSTLTETASDFVTAHAATILARTGIVVTADTGVLTFAGTTMDLYGLTITNATTNLAGTIVVTEVTATEGGCQTQYSTTQITNIVCAECDTIYTDNYTTTAPVDYDNVAWTLVDPAPAYSTDCLCGFKIKGKVLEVHPDESLRDEFGFIDSSVMVEVSGGYITEVREGLGLIEDNTFAVSYLSRAQPRTHLGGNLWQFEDQSMSFFTGEQRHESRVARFLLGEESSLEAAKQYVDYVVTIRRPQYAQSMSTTTESTMSLHLLVELGKHTNVETLVNKIAAAASKPGVQAYANV